MPKKQLDNLTQDALAASRCGMSYGKFKGLEYEQIQSGKRHAPLIEKKLRPGRRTFDLVCQFCGVQFVGGSRLKKYCSDLCKRSADGAAYRKNHPKTTKEEEQNDGNIRN
jgi:hypothetical protein